MHILLQSGKYPISEDGYDTQRIDLTYRQWHDDSARQAVSYISMEHGEKGAFSLYDVEKPALFSSCGGSAAMQRGYAQAITIYEDFYMEINILAIVDAKQAMAFMQDLDFVIEKRSL